MTLKRNTFEGQSVGVTPSVANSGAGSGDAFTSGEVSFSGTTGTVVDSPVAQGTRALRVVQVAGSAATGLVGYGFTANKTVSVQFFLRVAALPSATFVVLQGRYASGGLFGIDLTTAGALKFPSGTGGAAITAATSPALTLGTWYRVDLWLTQAGTPTTSNGSATYRVVRLSDDVEHFANTSAVADVGTAGTPDRVRFAKTGGSGSCDIYIDSPAVDDGLAGFITPLSDFQAPTGLAAVGSSQTTIAVSWDSVPTATSYTLQSATTEGGTYSTLYTGASLSYNHTGLTAGTTRWYKVQATK